jgi:hypothetical protein
LPVPFEIKVRKPASKNNRVCSVLNISSTKSLCSTRKLLWKDHETVYL